MPKKGDWNYRKEGRNKTDRKVSVNVSDIQINGHPVKPETSEMVRQTGKPVFDESGEILRKGTIVRHLVLPNFYKDSGEVIKRVGERFGGEILFSLMSQYTPFGEVKTNPEFKKMNRRITTFEYEKALYAVLEAGLQGFMQEKSSAKEEYTPSFDFTGI